MITLRPSFLIGTSSFLQETRACIKAWMSLNLNQIRPLTMLPALERLKNQCNCCQQSSTFIFDWIFFIYGGNEDNHKVLDKFEIWPDPTIDAELAALECLKKIPIDLQ